jgi:hypothetical protein
MMDMVLGQGQASVAFFNLERKKLRFIPEKDMDGTVWWK